MAVVDSALGEKYDYESGDLRRRSLTKARRYQPSGKMVARIIVDSQTLDQTVVAHDGEITIDEAWKVAEGHRTTIPRSTPRWLSASLKQLMLSFAFHQVSDEEIERSR